MTQAKHNSLRYRYRDRGRLQKCNIMPYSIGRPQKYLEDTNSIFKIFFEDTLEDTFDAYLMISVRVATTKQSPQNWRATCCCC